MNQKKTEPSPPSPGKIERPIPPKIYPVIDNDLARDNVENDLAAADLQELQSAAYFSRKPQTISPR